MHGRNITFMSILALGSAVYLLTGIGWFCLVGVVMGIVAIRLPIWPRKITLGLNLNEYEHDLAKAYFSRPMMSVRTKDIEIYVPRKYDLGGCNRFGFSLLDLGHEHLDTSEYDKTLTVRLRPPTTAQFLKMLQREDRYAEKVEYWTYNQVYDVNDRTWLPMRIERLKFKINQATLTPQSLVHFDCGVDDPKFWTLDPRALRIVVEPSLECCYLVDRMDFHRTHLNIRAAFIIVPSLDALRTIQDGPIADIIKVAHDHPGVVCRQCRQPHGIGNGTCHCGRFHGADEVSEQVSSA